MEAGGASSQRRGRRRRRVGEDDGAVADRISALPDAVLGEIISLLPTKDGARTQILASKWRHLWRSAPLNLDCRDLAAGRDLLAGVVSSILSSHLGPGRCFRGRDHMIPYATMEAWLRSPAMDNLQELQVLFDTLYKGTVHWIRRAPASISRFSDTLRDATIGKCSLDQALHLPHLKHLALQEVWISESLLRDMIAGCPALECLLIDQCFGLHTVVWINSVSLRTIAMRAECGELIIEDAPSLERLLHLDPISIMRVSVISAPKLETLRCISNPSKIQGLFHIDSLATVMRSVHVLAVIMEPLSLEIVIDLLRCFPCLEKFYIESSKSGPSNLWRRKHKNLSSTLDIRLKKIVFEKYRGVMSQVNFITLFVLNARLLESLTLKVWQTSEDFLAEQRKKLQLRKRASRGARFHFITDTCVRDFSHIEHVCDLDLADPFMC